MNYIHLPEATAKRIMEYLKQRPLNEPQFIADVGGLAVAISNAKPLPKKPGPKGKHKDPLAEYPAPVKWVTREEAEAMFPSKDPLEEDHY